MFSSVLALHLFTQMSALGAEGPYLRINWKNSVDALAISPDGKTLAVGDVEGSVHIWDLTRKREVATVREGKRFERIGCIGFLDRSTVVFEQLTWLPGGTAQETRLTAWDTERGLAKRTSFHPGGPLALSADAKKLLMQHGPKHSTVEMVDTLTGKAIPLVEDESTVRLGAISHDGSIVCLCNEKFLITVWDVATRKQLASKQLDELPRYVCLSPSGRYFVYNCENQRQFVLAGVDGKRTTVMDGRCPIVFSKADKVLLSVQYDGVFDKSDLGFFEVNTNKLTRSLVLRRDRSGPPLLDLLALSDDGEWVAAYAGGSIHIWHLDQGK